MSYFRNFLILSLFFIPILSFSDEKIEQSKYFVENLGKQVIEKVSNVNLSESERIVNFRNLYLDSFDNYYISIRSLDMEEQGNPGVQQASAAASASARAVRTSRSGLV